MRSFSRQRKASYDCVVLAAYDFLGSDYFWILRLWTDRQDWCGRARRSGLRTVPADEARLTGTC